MGHLQAKSKSPTLVPDFTNALVATCKQISPLEPFQEDRSKTGPLFIVDTNEQIFSYQLQQSVLKIFGWIGAFCCIVKKKTP